MKVKSVKQCCESEISETVVKVKSVKQLLFACYDRLVLLAVENKGKEGGQFQAQQVMCQL